jgi:plastocyanin
MRSHTFSLPVLTGSVAVVSLLLLSMCTAPGGTSRQTPTGPETRPSVIQMTGTGFSPRALSVSIHTTVCWENKDTADRWPVADTPSKDIAPDFTAPKQIKKGEIWCFPFPRIGAWTYHDKDNAKFKGTITVTAPR